MSQLIVPFLWFDSQAEEAAALYTSLFADGRVVRVTRQGEDGVDAAGRPRSRALLVEMELAGTLVTGLNGGPRYQHTPAVSFFVQLESAAEVDALWAGLGAGGSVLMPLGEYPWSPYYGWLNDRFGVSWQISQGPRSDVPRTLSPLLTFTGERFGRASEALKLYTSLFPRSSVTGIMRSDFERTTDPDAVAPATVLHAQFELAGETFMALDSNEAHGFTFTPAFSFMIPCKDQSEVDRHWEALIADGGAESMCGWLVDRFGVSWQVVPTVLFELMAQPDRAAAGRVLQALLGMRRLDIAALEAAARG